MNDVSALPPAVRAYVHGFAVRGRWLSALRGIGVAAGLFLGWMLLCCVLDRFLHFTPWARLGMLAVGAAASVVALVRPLRGLVRRDTDWVEVAERIERQNPRFDQRLVTVTSRLLGRAEYRGSDEILEHLVYEVNRQAEEEQASRLLPLRMVARPWLMVALLALVATGLFQVPGLGFPRLTQRFVTPLGGVAPVTTTRLRVTPGDRDVAQSAPLQVEVEVEQLGGGQVWLQATEDGTTWSRFAMTPASAATSSAATNPSAGDSRFAYTFNAIDRDTRYYVVAGDATSREFAVRVLRAPAVTEFRIRYIYPAYTGRPPLSVTNTDGVIEAPVGTEAIVTVVATEPLQSALMNVGTERIVMSRQGDANVRQGRLTVLKEAEGRYGLDIISTREQAGTGPLTMQIRAQPDHPPVVRVTGQASDSLRLNPRDILPLDYEAIDDYAVESVVLRTQVGNNPTSDVPVDGADASVAVAGPGAGQRAPPAPAARRREGVFNFDLASTPLNLGDVLTLVLVSRDSAGQQSFSEPLHVLVSPRSIDLDTYERVADLAVAAQLAERLADELSDAAKSLGDGANRETDDAAATAAGRTSRSLSGAAETAALLRRSLLRAIVHGAAPDAATALAGWVDAAQSRESTAQALFARFGAAVDDAADGTDPEDAAQKRARRALRSIRETLQREVDEARSIQSNLLTVAHGERAAAVLMDRENLTTLEKRPAPSDGKAAERFRQTLKRAREDVEAGASALELNASAGDLGSRLRSKVQASANLVKSRGPIDFASAAKEWSQQLQENASRPALLDERLAAAAQAEAVRADADLQRARDLDISSRAAAAIGAQAAAGTARVGPNAISPAILNEYAAATAALQREHEANRRASDVRRDDQADLVRKTAAQARQKMAQWAGDAMVEAVASSLPVSAPASDPSSAPASAPATDRSILARQAARPEALALEAGAALAGRDYAKAADVDRTLARQIAGAPPMAVPATAPDGADDPQTADGPPAAPLGRTERSLRDARRASVVAERIDGIGDQQNSVADAARSLQASSATSNDVNESAAGALAQRQREVADQIAEVDRPAAATSTEGGDPNVRDRATAAILTAQSQLAAMPQQLAEYLEFNAARREAATRAEAARREADGASPDRKSSAERTATQAEQDAKESSGRLDVAARPVSPVVGEVMAGSIEPFAPELSPARDVIGLQLVPALRALREAGKSSDPAQAGRAAAEARQAIDAAQRELASAQDAFTQRDPLASAKWFARAAADALNRRPPDFVSAERHQRSTAGALARAWDRSIHKAAAHRLAAVPALRALFEPGAGAAEGGVVADATRAVVSSPGGVVARDFRRLRSRDGEDANAALRETDPAGYEAALKVYFEALGRGRDAAR